MKNRTFWWTTLAGALALFATGCGGKKGCEELCNLTDACPDVFPEDGTCADRCKAKEVFNKAAACVPQQEAYDECVSALAEVCTAADDCRLESLALYDCADDYCKANPSATGCPSP